MLLLVGCSSGTTSKDVTVPSTGAPDSTSASTVTLASSSGDRVVIVQGENLTPFLHPGDKLTVRPGAPVERGSIVLFHRPQTVDAEDLSRVVGLPGESIEGRNGIVLVEGRPLEESYLPSGTPTSDFGPVVIPAGSYWVIGDNRTNSSDSRVFGPIPGFSIIGVVISYERAIVS